MLGPDNDNVTESENDNEERTRFGGRGVGLVRGVVMELYLERTPPVIYLWGDDGWWLVFLSDDASLSMQLTPGEIVTAVGMVRGPRELESSWLWPELPFPGPMERWLSDSGDL